MRKLVVGLIGAHVVWGVTLGLLADAASGSKTSPTTLSPREQILKHDDGQSRYLPEAVVVSHEELATAQA